MYCIVTVVRFVIILIKFYVCMYVCNKTRTICDVVRSAVVVETHPIVVVVRQSYSHLPRYHGNHCHIATAAAADTRRDHVARYTRRGGGTRTVSAWALIN